MIPRIIRWSAENPLLVALLVLFAAAAAGVALHSTPLDAIPDLSDPQVILFTEWMGRSPTLVEDQITYPLVSALVSAPRVTSVRGYSMLGMSFIYILFEEGTDAYWARSRVLESLGSQSSRLPPGVTPQLGPDATGVGWAFQYVLEDPSGKHDLAELRSFQDFHLRYALASVPGVAEVAAVGGYGKEYQVAADPVKLRARGVTMAELADRVRESNDEVSGRVIEMAGRELTVRGRGYVKDLQDLEEVALKVDPATGTPVRVRDVATVSFGPGMRRGLLEWNGDGEAVGAIVVVRQGQNALAVIRAVKEKLAELRPSLPEGVSIRTAYDRSALIDRAIDTLRHTLVEEAIVVSLCIVAFLLHLRSALVPIALLPLAVLLAFLPMTRMGITANIMSLGGIAIAVGALVDAAIVMVENAHKRLCDTHGDRKAVLVAAASEVGPAIFFSLLIITVSFLPIFALQGQAGRLFKPLAFTKTFTMAFAAILSITLGPALMPLLIRGRIFPEDRHPISRALIALYKPFVYVALRKPRTTVLIGAFAIASAIPLAGRLGNEFMPPLFEGDLLYMPTTLPNLSIEEAKSQIQRQDRALASFPEVASVFGKIGRAETATDPAPLSMVETTAVLKPPSEWRRIRIDRFYRHWPAFLLPPLRALLPDERPMSWDELCAEMNGKLAFPGWVNAFTMPIKTRIDMLTTGVRTPVGIKILGDDLEQIERIGLALEKVLPRVPMTRSVFYERTQGGLYLDVVPDRKALPRYGLTTGDVMTQIESAIGGERAGTAVDGRRRLPITVRFLRDFRQDAEAIRRIPIPAPGGELIPLGSVARTVLESGPPMVRDENGLLAGYVYIDFDTRARDMGGYVADAKAEVAKAIASGEIHVPPGTFLKWTGQYELLEAMQRRMRVLVPLTLAIVVLLLYFHFGNIVEVLIVLLSIPFALVGSVWLLYLLGYHLSTAVWVGIIALVGLAAQTGIVMIVYIDRAYERRKAAGLIRNLDDIIWAHMEGTVMRVRPKVMTVSTMLFGLVPLLWAQGSGADVMKRIAAPMVGGLLTSAFLTLEIIPVIYTYWRFAQLKREQRLRSR